MYEHLNMVLVVVRFGMVAVRSAGPVQERMAEALVMDVRSEVLQEEHWAVER